MKGNVEIYFSEIKRLFGEVIRIVKAENIVQEMMRKECFYNEYNKFRRRYKLCNIFLRHNYKYFYGINLYD